MAVKVCWHENPYFLQDDHYTTTTMWMNEGNAALVLEDGEYLLKAGTIWPSNDQNAQGIVLRDVLVPSGCGGVTFALITHGRINPDYLPAAPTANAVSALNNITFSNPGTDNTSVPAGYFTIKNHSSVVSVSSGTFEANDTISSSVVVDAISPAAFVSTPDILAFQVSNYTYPVYVSAVTVAGSSATLTIKARKKFHCHAGEEITLCVQPEAFSAATYPSNVITVVKFS